MVIVRPAMLNRYILSFDESRLDQALAERSDKVRGAGSRRVLLRKPITGIPACCARATSGHAAAPPSSVMNCRRFIRSPRRQSFA
jgi:hypothetical protein